MNLHTIKQLLHDPEADKNLLFKFGLALAVASSIYQLIHSYENAVYLLTLLFLYFFQRFVIKPVITRYRMLQAFDSLLHAHQHFVANAEKNVYASIERDGFSAPPERCPENLRPISPMTPSSFLNTLPLLSLKAFDIRYRWDSIYQRLYQRHQLVNRFYRLHVRLLGVTGDDLPTSHLEMESISKLLLDYRLESPRLFQDNRYEGQQAYLQDDENYNKLLSYLNMLDYQKKHGKDMIL